MAKEIPVIKGLRSTDAKNSIIQTFINNDINFEIIREYSEELKKILNEKITEAGVGNVDEIKEAIANVVTASLELKVMQKISQMISDYVDPIRDSQNQFIENRLSNTVSEVNSSLDMKIDVFSKRKDREAADLRTDIFNNIADLNQRTENRLNETMTRVVDAVTFMTNKTTDIRTELTNMIDQRFNQFKIDVGNEYRMYVDSKVQECKQYTDEKINQLKTEIRNDINTTLGTLSPANLEILLDKKVNDLMSYSDNKARECKTYTDIKTQNLPITKDNQNSINKMLYHNPIGLFVIDGGVIKFLIDDITVDDEDNKRLLSAVVVDSTDTKEVQFNCMNDEFNWANVNFKVIDKDGNPLVYEKDFTVQLEKKKDAPTTFNGKAVLKLTDTSKYKTLEKCVIGLV